MVANKKAAFIFGGANEDGPLNDLYEFEFSTRTFKKRALKGLAIPAIEMHTAHIY